MLDLLGCGVHLLLALLGSTTQTQHQVKSGLLLDVVVREGAAVFELLAGEDQALLVGRDAFLVCGAAEVTMILLSYRKIVERTYLESWI